MDGDKFYTRQFTFPGPKTTLCSVNHCRPDTPAMSIVRRHLPLGALAAMTALALAACSANKSYASPQYQQAKFRNSQPAAPREPAGIGKSLKLMWRFLFDKP